VLNPTQLAINGGIQPQIVDNPALRVSSGIGVSWASPVGPVRLDLGVPVKRESYDKSQFFRVSFGTRF
jgi:outer membrane protein insertion porin family